jgi:KDO2-lipid IV(A) lauroyltransferase
LALFKALNKGAALVFLIDLAVSDGEVVSFMSKPAYTSFTTASFALKADALFLPHFSMRNPDRESLRVEIGTVIGHSEAITMTKKGRKNSQATHNCRFRQLALESLQVETHPIVRM